RARRRAGLPAEPGRRRACCADRPVPCRRLPRFVLRAGVPAPPPGPDGVGPLYRTRACFAKRRLGAGGEHRLQYATAAVPGAAATSGGSRIDVAANIRTGGL